MFVRTYAGAIVGIDAAAVAVEVNIAGGGLGMYLVGLPDNAVKESEQRIRAAFENSGERMSGRKVVVSLAPADLRKEGASFDLPIAVGILAAMGRVDAGALGGTMFAGELSLDGTLKPVRGVLPVAIRARSEGLRRVVLPAENAAEAAVVDGIGVIGVTTLREVVYDIGGGIPNGKKFKAAQTGGPSGGCIPAEHLDVPIDYDNLIAIGSMMGSGGLIVMDEDNCMVDIAKFFLEFTVDESCGKCTPCRVGCKRLLELLTKVTDGTATMDDLDEMEKLCYYIKDNALCGLGQTAPNPVLSTLKYFRHEYEEHILEKKCSAGVCKHLLHFEIDKEKCIGCTLCARNCPVNAISGSVKQPHEIDQTKCIKCGVCMQNCKFKAISKK